MDPSPLPWRISDSHGLCIADAEGHIVADLTPRLDWGIVPHRQRLRANAEAIVEQANHRTLALQRISASQQRTTEREKAELASLVLVLDATADDLEYRARVLRSHAEVVRVRLERS